jgi:UrcA family protein
MLRNTLPPLLAIALAASAASAVAAPAGEQVSARVRVADLNLQNEAGAQVALRRIHQAARVVCGGEPDQRELARRASFQACLRDTVDRTVAAAHSPALAALNGAPASGATVAAID